MKPVSPTGVKASDVVFFGYEAKTSGFPKEGLTPPFPDLYDALPLILVTQVARTKSSKLLVSGMNVNYLETRIDRGKVVLSLRFKAKIPSRLYRQMIHTYRVDRMKTPMFVVPDIIADPNIFNSFGEFKQV